MTKAILIDDEQDSLIAIREQITMYCPDVEVLGMYDDPVRGLEAVKTRQPDCVLLDIVMPKMNGLEVARQIASIPTRIIFVTSYDQYAIDAIKLSALDYLLKPISDPDELRDALEKVKASGTNQAPRHKKNNLPLLTRLLDNEDNNSYSQDTIICLSDEEETLYVKMEDIIRLESQRNYCLFHIAGKAQKLISKNLGYFLNGLLPYGFKQAHRAHLVNCRHVRKCVKKDGPYLVMSDESTVPVSQSFRGDF